jgi:hypothetical protein
MKRDAEVMSHGPRDKKSPGNLNHLAYVLGHGDGDRWNPSELNGALNQSDRLVANRSSGGQQCKICLLVFADGTGNIGSNRPLEPLRVHVVADETEEIPR